jgi:hypothetical protein
VFDLVRQCVQGLLRRAETFGEAFRACPDADGRPVVNELAGRQCELC